MSRESDRDNAYRYNAVPAAWEEIRPAAIARDCFADEIAIDFPSVGRAVERIREGFLEEHPAVEVLATELRLSMVEARRGLVVPLDVPMRGTCSRCGAWPSYIVMHNVGDKLQGAWLVERYCSTCFEKWKDSQKND